MNLYTQLTPAKFDPLSLNEVMMVPLAKQKMHDDTIKASSDELNRLYQVQALEPHNEVVKSKISELETGLNNLTQGITREGINRGYIDQFTKLKSTSDKEMSPQGTLGQAGLAYKAFQESKARSIQNMINTGKYNPKQAAEHWDKHSANYANQFLETGKIVPIEDRYGFLAQDHEQDISNAHKLLGHYVKQLSNDVVSVDYENGVPVFKNKHGETLTDSNIQNIQEAYKSYKAKWATPGGEGYEWAKDAGLDLDNLNKNAEYSFNSMIVDKNLNSSSVDIKPISTGEGRGSGDDDDNNPIITSHSSETIPLGKDHRKLIKESNTVLNSPTASVQEKNMARQKLDLVDDIKSDLIGEGIENSKLTSKQKVYRDKEQFIYNVNNSKFLSDLISTAEKEKSPYLNNLKKLQKSIKSGKLDDVSSPNIFFTKGVTVDNELYDATRLGKYAEKLDDFFGKYIGTYNKYNKQIKDEIDNQLSKRGLEATKLSYNYKNQAAKDTEMMNLKDAMDTDFAKATDIIYIDKGGKKERVEMDEGIAFDAINLLKSSDEKSMNANVTRRGDSIGMTIKFSPQKDNELTPAGIWNNKSFGDGQAIEMYVPISNISDAMTGMRHTQTRVYNMLPLSLQKQVDNIVLTGGSGVTTRESRLGQNATLANNYFKGKFKATDKIDFLKSKDGLITPYIIGKDKKEMKWSDIVDYSKLSDMDYITKLANSDIIDDIENTYKRTTNKNPIKFNNGSYDYESMLKELKDKAIKLKSLDEIMDFTTLNN